VARRHRNYDSLNSIVGSASWIRTTAGMPITEIAHTD